MCVYTMSLCYRQDLVRDLQMDMDMCASMCEYEAYDMRVKCVNVCVHVEFVMSTRLSS